MTGSRSEDSILVFRTGQLGDTVVAMPAIQEIAARNPEKNLLLLTDRQDSSRFFPSWDLLKHTRWFRSALFYPASKRGMGRLWTMIRLALQLRKLHPAKIYYLSQNRRSASQIRRDLYFFKNICGIRKTIGFDQMEHPPRSAEVLPRMQKESARLLDIVKEGKPALSGPFYFPVPEQEKEEARKIFAQSHFSQDHKIVALCVGSKMSAKCWPLENYVSFCERLLRESPEVRLMILGGEEDRGSGEVLSGKFGDRALNLAGKTPILLSAALLRRSHCYVGNDTGLMHLAAAVGVRCVCIFSARDYPGLWEPFGEGHIILRHEVECSGCMLQDCVEKAMKCIKLISVNEVLQATSALLEKPAY